MRHEESTVLVVTTVLALIAAVAWAFGDFASAIASRKFPSLAIVAWGQLTGFALMLPIAVALGGHPTVHDLTLGAAAGFFNVLGYYLFVEGMSRSRMGVVIPTSVVSSTLIPVIVGVATGDPVTALIAAGILAALAGAGLAATDPDSTNTRYDSRAVKYGTWSGVGFAVMFILLSQTDESSGIWPVLCMRLASPFVFLFGWKRGIPLKPNRSLIKYATFVVLGGTIALPAYTVAVRDGSLSVITAIASTSPAGTVVLAHFLGHERTSRWQVFGVLLAITGIVLLSLR